MLNNEKQPGQDNSIRLGTTGERIIPGCTGVLDESHHALVLVLQVIEKTAPRVLEDLRDRVFPLPENQRREAAQAALETGNDPKIRWHGHRLWERKVRQLPAE